MIDKPKILIPLKEKIEDDYLYKIFRILITQSKTIDTEIFMDLDKIIDLNKEQKAVKLKEILLKIQNKEED